MRLLLHTYDLAFLRMGGGERVILALAEALGRAGVRAELWDPWRHRAEDFDAIHTFSCRQGEDWDFFSRWHARLPLFVTPTLSDRPVSRRQASADFFLRARFRQPRLFFPATDSEAIALAQRFGVARSRMRVLPNGIDPAITQGNPGLAWSRLGIAPQEMVLCVGRFEPVKNQLLLLEAAEVRGRGLYVFLGDADPADLQYRQACEERARKIERSSEAKIRFLPAVAHSDSLLAGLYAAATVYVQPSRFETFGLAALEAYVSGCAMALSDGMAARSIFEAHFFSPEDPKACAEAVEAQAKMTRQPRPDLAQRYSWDSVALALAGFYREGLNELSRRA